ncbi:hypothetical protein TELCIR_03920 [Teladorsagia circumcincta]|uniref:Uncharacterized protein n=1 Tax=Teladorsagia circumcincta TaxID=45464 RepID=A0A2G9UWI0_TELCI|nr:hypothetical protein TELCIR_03920 [Teladorsagia circumcincta]
MRRCSIGSMIREDVKIQPHSLRAHILTTVAHYCVVHILATVAPILLQALGALAKERPENHIDFMINFLNKEKEHYEPSTENVSQSFCCMSRGNKAPSLLLLHSVDN